MQSQDRRSGRNGRSLTGISQTRCIFEKHLHNCICGSKRTVSIPLRIQEKKVRLQSVLNNSRRRERKLNKDDRLQCVIYYITDEKALTRRIRLIAKELRRAHHTLNLTFSHSDEDQSNRRGEMHSHSQSFNERKTMRNFPPTLRRLF